MRIAIFTDTFFPNQVNGVARAAYRQAEVLRNLGHEVRVWSVHNTPSFSVLGYRGERMALPSLSAYREAVAWRPEIVHVHTPFSLGWEAMLVARKLGVPLVGTHHTFFDHYLKHVRLDFSFMKRLSWLYLAIFYNRCRLVLSPSKALLQEMRTKGLTASARIFPNSVDTEDFAPIPVSAREEAKKRLGLAGPTLIYMGRVSYEKSIDKVLEAFALVRKEHPDAALLIAGDGPELETLEARARRLGLGGSVRFLGMLHAGRLVEALQASDIFLTASKSENMPLSVLEAMATGLPVIGVDALGMPEIVADGLSGFIVAPDDAIAMAARALEVLADRRLELKLRRQARKRAESFGEQAQAEALLGLYRNLIERPFTVSLYLEFLHFMKGALFKDLGTGLLSSYRNQKKMLEEMRIPYTEKWDASASILQINTPWLSSLFVMWRARRRGIPIIVWAHVTAEDIRGVFWFGNLVSPLMKRYLAFAYNQADIILTPSEYTKGLVERYGIPPEKVLAQSNGVDLAQFFPSAEKRAEGRRCLGAGRGDFLVGTVALAIPRKGIDTFLSLARRFSEMRFAWVGKIYSGALAKPLPKDLPSNARFTGFVPDILAAYNAFDAFLFASYEENQGMAILEAAAVGLPIIVRDIPVYEGWLIDGENCLKAKSEEEFAAHLARLASDQELRTKLGAGALTLASAESLEALSNRLRDIYDRLLTR